MATLMIRELDLIEKFRDLSLVNEVTADSVKLGMFKMTSGFLDEIRESHKSHVNLVDRLSLDNKDKCFKVNEHGILKFWDRVCVLDVLELKKTILDESHRSGLSVHPRATKMYQVLKRMLWWI